MSALSEMDQLETFLEGRGLADSVKKLRENKIDHNILLLMTDEQLKDYFPFYGDRLAVTNFCSRLLAKDEKDKKKDHLLGRLRAKLKLKRSRENDESDNDEDLAKPSVKAKLSSTHKFGNTNAKKNMRLIEMGWIHRDDIGVRKQMRKRNGGGTRKTKVEKALNVHDLIAVGKMLFFPDGVSPIGRADDFDFSVMDFKENTLESTDTVGNLYERTQMAMLRFYIVTTKRETQESTPEITDTVSPPVAAPIFQIPIPQIPIISIDNLTKTTPIHVDWSDAEIQFGALSGDVDETFSVTLPYIPLVTSSPVENASPAALGTENQVPKEYSTLPDIPLERRSRVQNTCPAALGAPPLDQQPDLRTEAGNVSLDPEQQRLPCQAPPRSPATLPLDELPDLRIEAGNAFLDLERPALTDELLIRRGFAVDDMIDAFVKDPSLGQGPLFIKRLLPNGNYEAGDDTGGVLRDVLSEFWDEFYKKCTVGANVKVPFLRHDYDHQKWGATARILKAGYHQTGYFPIKFAPSFMKQVVSKPESGPPGQESLLKDFLNFIPLAEKETITKGLEDYQSVDVDDLVDIFDDHSARRLPTPANLKATIMEIADKELTQEPMYVIDCWRQHLGGLLTPAAIDSLYAKLKPTPKQVVKMITFPAVMTSLQTEVKKHLTKFIKEMDVEQLGNFLRFCTGADLMCTVGIEVSFTKLTGFERRPIAHTCAGLLEIPENYANYPDFRREFESLLKSNVWVMDFI